MIAQPPILCVDDDRDTLEVIEASLNMAGFQVAKAMSTPEGLRLIRQNEMAAIIVDAWLPAVSGFTLCEHVRRRDNHTPIIFYSAAAYASDIARGMEVGAQ